MYGLSIKHTKYYYMGGSMSREKGWVLNSLKQKLRLSGCDKMWLGLNNFRTKKQIYLRHTGWEKLEGGGRNNFESIKSLVVTYFISK